MCASSDSGSISDFFPEVSFDKARLKVTFCAVALGAARRRQSSRKTSRASSRHSECPSHAAGPDGAKGAACSDEVPRLPSAAVGPMLIAEWRQVLSKQWFGILGLASGRIGLA